MKKELESIKHGFLIGLSFSLTIGLTFGVYAGWTDLSNVSTGDNLTSTTWNNILGNLKYLKDNLVWKISGSNTYYSDGKVGIGTSTFNSSSNVSGNNALESNSEFISTNANAFRAVNGNYGVVLRNDGNGFMFGITPSGSKYNSASYFPLSYGFTDNRLTLFPNHGSNDFEGADIMFRGGKAASGNDSKKANGYWNSFTFDNYAGVARINPYSLESDGTQKFANWIPFEVMGAKGGTSIGHDGALPYMELRSFDSSASLGGYIDFVNGNNTSEDFDGRIALTDDNTFHLDGASFDYSAWPSGHYCIIQAIDNACPTGFSALNPESGQGGGSAILGNSTSGYDNRNIKRPDEGSNRHTSKLSWAFCCK